LVIYFVTPAWQRYELSEVCFEQRRRVVDHLNEHGIEAHCVVVADDENIDLALSKGFEVFKQDNEWLGRRFNDGIQYAAHSGAEWIVPIGSDSWIDPAYFLPLPDPSLTRSSKMYAAVTSGRIGYLNVAHPTNPAGPHMIHRSRLPESLRPTVDERNRYIDSATLAGLSDLRFEFRDLHPLQYIGFRGQPHLTPYDRLWTAWGVRESTDPWTELATVYPQDLVDRARECLSSAPAPTSPG
jgi:glycosyltransferase involved in cell wall biosynthesis